MLNNYIYNLLFDIHSKFIVINGVKIKIEKIKRYIEKTDIFINDIYYINILKISKMNRKNGVIYYIYNEELKK